MPFHKKKLLMISGLFHPLVGGTERECRKIAGKLKELGYNVTVLTRYQEGLPAHEMIDGFPVYRYIKGWHLFEISYMLSVLSFLIRHRHNIDNILCFGLYLFTAPAVIFCRLTGRRIFFRIESPGNIHRISKLKYKGFVLRCAKMAHGAIAFTREIEEKLIEKGFPKKKIVKIPNSVDTEMFSPSSPKAEDPFVICYIGRIAAFKGLETFIKALRRLMEHTENFKVLIVGDGEFKTSLIEQVERSGLKQFVSFIGEVDNVVPYYHRSHVFVLPSLSEGMPLSLLEAMACGLGVVGTRVGGIAELMGTAEETAPEQKGYQVCKNGIMFTPKDEAALSAAFLKLINDRELRYRLGRNASKTIETTYALKKVINQYLKLFEPN
jgi:glycosyltransferase involved in cell wall biosynthesis